jgi:hypothetical protein
MRCAYPPKTGPFKDERHRGEYKTDSNRVAAYDADGISGLKTSRSAPPVTFTPRLLSRGRIDAPVTIRAARLDTGINLNPGIAHTKTQRTQRKTIH